MMIEPYLVDAVLARSMLEELRAKVKDLTDRNEEWHALFDRLPRTADGVTPIPPFNAWRVDGLGEIAPFLIKELYPMHALAFGSGIERWQASCVFADRELAMEEATRRVTAEKFRAIG